MKLEALKDRLAALVGVDLPKPRLSAVAWAQIDAEYGGLSAKERAELVDWLETQRAAATGQTGIDWVFIQAALTTVEQLHVPKSPGRAAQSASVTWHRYAPVSAG